MVSNAYCLFSNNYIECKVISRFKEIFFWMKKKMFCCVLCFYIKAFTFPFNGVYSRLKPLMKHVLLLSQDSLQNLKLHFDAKKSCHRKLITKWLNWLETKERKLKWSLQIIDMYFKAMHILRFSCDFWSSSTQPLCILAKHSS